MLDGKETYRPLKVFIETIKRNKDLIKKDDISVVMIVADDDGMASVLLGDFEALLAGMGEVITRMAKRNCEALGEEMDAEALEQFIDCFKEAAVATWRLENE